MDAVALLVFCATIVLAFVFKVNTGLIAIVAALVLSRFVNIGDKWLLNSFDSSQGGFMNAQNQNETGNDMNASQTSEASVTDPNEDPSDPVEDWLAPEGSSLRELLTEWGDKAGWRVVWNTDREYIYTYRPIR